MKYVALDIETTGLDRELDQVLQIALVVENTAKPEIPVEDLPTFEALIEYTRLSGNPIALSMNKEILDFLGKRAKGEESNFRSREVSVYLATSEALTAAICWLDDQYISLTKLVAAGKNAGGFDLPFLGGDFQKKFHHRVIDVGSVALGANRDYWQKDTPPGMRELHDGVEATHDAIEDARDVIRLLRKLTNNYR